jgi:hypothetical protein
MHLLGISETVLCLMSVPQVRILFVPDSLQVLKLYTGTLTYLEARQFLLLIFYNATFNSVLKGSDDGV